MIAGLRGTIEATGIDFVVITVSGVSYKVFVPASSLPAIGAVGAGAKLYTHLHVREDALSLYGFVTPDHLTAFEMLLGVTGIGPKVALSILSAIPPDRFMWAVATENAELFTRVPGVGKKVAARLILELRGKIEPGRVPASTPAAHPDQAQVMAALGALGYTAAEAAAAVASLPSSLDLPPEEKIRLALSYFANR